MASFATVSDLAAHVQQGFDEYDTYSADQALQIATDQICSYLRRPYAELTPPTATLKGICLDVAGRRMNNPLGRTNETTPGYAYTNASTAFGLSAEEKTVLDGTGLGARGGAYSISLVPADPA